MEEIATRPSSFSIDELSLVELPVGEVDLSVPVRFVIDPLPLVNKASLLFLHRHQLLGFVMSLGVDFEWVGR